jgi:hypothetical protein
METLTSSVTAMMPSAHEIGQAYTSKNWMLMLSLCLTLGITIARKMGLLSMIDDENHKWVALAVAMAGSAGGGLMSGASWPEIAVTGLMGGIMSVGGYETAGKMIKGALAKKPAEAPPAAPPPSDSAAPKA